MRQMHAQEKGNYKYVEDVIDYTGHSIKVALNSLDPVTNVGLCSQSVLVQQS